MYSESISLCVGMRQGYAKLPAFARSIPQWTGAVRVIGNLHSDLKHNEYEEGVVNTCLFYNLSSLWRQHETLLKCYMRWWGEAWGQNSWKDSNKPGTDLRAAVKESPQRAGGWVNPRPTEQRVGGVLEGELGLQLKCLQDSWFESWLLSAVCESVELWGDGIWLERVGHWLSQCSFCCDRTLWPE